VLHITIFILHKKLIIKYLQKILLQVLQSVVHISATPHNKKGLQIASLNMQKWAIVK
jgi:hypothetical protein